MLEDRYNYSLKGVIAMIDLVKNLEILLGEIWKSDLRIGKVLRSRTPWYDYLGLFGVFGDFERLIILR